MNDPLLNSFDDDDVVCCSKLKRKREEIATLKPSNQDTISSIGVVHNLRNQFLEHFYPVTQYA